MSQRLGAILFLAGATAFAEPHLILPAGGSIGRNLEAFTSVRLSEVAASRLEVTVTSSDPRRLVFANNPDEPGTPELHLKVNAQYPETPDFYLQAVGAPGEITYTATAPGYAPATGRVTITPSAILLVGPMQAPTFQTTPRTPVPVRIMTTSLDADGNVGQQQPLAGGLKVDVQMDTSDAHVGALKDRTLTLAGGSAMAATKFVPAGDGSAVLTAHAPPGFTFISKLSTVTGTVITPGIGVLTDLYVGKDLQVVGYVLLGEAAPPDGLDVTLRSADPSRLLLSDRVDRVGSASITLHIPPGELKAKYVIQGLADSGIVNYSATAIGYRDRSARVGLTAAGVMVVYAPYGAPDEAEVLRKNLVLDPRPFAVSLSEHKPAPLAVWTVYLDPVTHRGADMTAQMLRPGVQKTVELTSSDPAVGKVTPRVKLSSAEPYTVADFTPVAAGQTVISVRPPDGFAQPSNATSVTATVNAE